MSNVGVMIQGRTAREIRDAALRTRDLFGIGRSGRLSIPVEWLLANRVEPLLGVSYDPRTDNDPAIAGAYALYSPVDKVILVRESILRTARHADDPEANFTIAHELGHVILHTDPKYYRRKAPTHLPAGLCDPEVQADRFAMEFLVDREGLVAFRDPVSAAAYFRVPVLKMQIFLQQLRREGVIVPPTTRPSPLDQAYQDGFEF